MSDKRLTDRLLNYWTRLYQAPVLPTVERFNPSAVHDIWPNCMRVKVQPGAHYHNFYFDYVGDQLKKVLSRNLTGTVLNVKMMQTAETKLLSRLEEAVTSRQPIAQEGAFPSPIGKVVHYRACILPFGRGTEESAVTHVIVGISFKEV